MNGQCNKVYYIQVDGKPHECHLDVTLDSRSKKKKPKAKANKMPKKKKKFGPKAKAK